MNECTEMTDEMILTHAKPIRANSMTLIHCRPPDHPSAHPLQEDVALVRTRIVLDKIGVPRLESTSICIMVLILTPTESPLSNRGSELSVLGSRFEQFKVIFGNLYDPDTNPDGIVNLGVSENVSVPSLERRIL